MCDSITERFFRAPGSRTKYFERIFCRSVNYILKYIFIISFNPVEATKNGFLILLQI